MASRTFGGTIKLSGEDKYRKALSSIKDNLTVVSSELKATTSAFDKNNASADDLNKTNDVLSKKLKVQKEKLEVLKKALSDAESETGKNSITTKKWETELNKAQAEVNRTTLEIKNNQNQLKKLSSEVVDSIDSVDSLGASFKETGNEAAGFGDIVKGNVVASFIVDGIKSISSLVAEMGKQFMEIGATVQKSSNQMQAALGLTNEEAKKYNEIMKNIYNAGYGDSFEDIATKIGYVKQVTGEIDPSNIEQLTKNAMSLENTFGSDFNETIRGVNNLMTHFGISSEEAFDLFAKGSQLGLDYTGELGDNVAEYAGNFQQAGYSAEEYFQLLKNGTQNGAYNLDKVNDSINEIKNKLGDGTIKANLSMFSSETQQAFKNWESGKGTMKDVIDSIVTDINNCTNEQEQLNMAATAFGTMGEDANLKVVTSLTAVGDEFQNVKGSMESIQDIEFSDIGSAFETIKRQIQTNIVTPIFNEALPAFEELSKGLQDSMNGDTIDFSKAGESIGTFIADIGQQLIEGIPTLTQFLFEGIVGLIESLAPNLGDIAEKLLTSAAAIITQIGEQLPTLIPTIVDGILSIIPMLTENLDQFVNAGINLLMGLATGIINAIPSLIESIPTVIQGIVTMLTTQLPTIIALGITLIAKLAEGIIKAIPSLLVSIAKIPSSIINGIKKGLSNIASIGKNLIKGLWEGINDAKDWLINKIKSLGKTILDGIKSIFGIHSPSTVFRDEIGKNLALGIGVGFDQNIGKIAEDIKNSIPTFDIGLNSNIDSLPTNNYGVLPSDNFNVTINNNSKYISPAENARQMRSQAQWYFLNKRRRA